MDNIVNTVVTPMISEIPPNNTDPIPPAPIPKPMERPDASAKFFGNNICIYMTLTEKEERTLKPKNNNMITVSHPST